jgi:MFS family permease
MKQLFQHRPMRLIFIANMISMFGSGMNMAAVTWYLLQQTHSEIPLGKLTVLQVIPALLLLPFSGVVIDREDRRHLIMGLDALRGVVVLLVAVLTLRGALHTWELYAMAVLVAAGFWMFWPTIGALIQELTPGTEYVRANTLLLAGVQGGWLMAGALVGFVYNHIGLGWILVIDFATYMVSFLCYLAVRRGRHVVKPPQPQPGTQAGSEAAQNSRTAWGKYVHELLEGVRYVKARPQLVLLGTSMALFLGAMLTQGVVTAPLSDRILKSGAVGYGWLNGSWGVGAFLSAMYAPAVIARLRSHRAAGISLGGLAVFLALLPFSRTLAIAVLFYLLMGSARGISGTAISSEIMEIVPKHFMGRVQNTFYFAGTLLQLAMGMGVAAVAHRISLTAAFAIVGGVYLVACLSATWPVARHSDVPQTAQAAAE